MPKKKIEGLWVFFMKHMKIIKDGKLCCAECGGRLQGHVSEVAHILPKSGFPSIALADDNVIYLCGMYSDTQCHTKFDNCSTEAFRKMEVFKIVSEVFPELEGKLTENISYKIYDRYGNIK